MPFDENRSYTIPELIDRVNGHIDNITAFVEEFCDDEGEMIGNPTIARLYEALNNSVEAESVCSLVIEMRERLIDTIVDEELRETVFKFFDAGLAYSEHFATQTVTFMAQLGIPLPFGKRKDE